MLWSLEHSSYSNIPNNTSLLSIYKYVPQLDIPVDDQLRMKFPESRKNVDKHPHFLLKGKFLLSQKKVPQIAILKVGHEDRSKLIVVKVLMRKILDNKRRIYLFHGLNFQIDVSWVIVCDLNSFLDNEVSAVGPDCDSWERVMVVNCFYFLPRRVILFHRNINNTILEF